MRPENEPKRKTIRRRHTYKTKDDFMRWLKKQDAFKKQAAEEQIRQTDPATSRALMVWADDGGRAA